MSEAKVASYGSWVSPISADLVVGGGVKLSQVTLLGGHLYWVESRPEEAGRCVLMRRTREGRIEDITPDPFSVRSRVHEYGGGAYLVGEEFVVFSNDSDQRLYRQEFGGEPVALTPEGPYRYADGVLDATRGRVISICEDHSEGLAEPVNSIVSVDLNSGQVSTLETGYDFYASPRIGPSDSQLAWLCWNHPNMPWDGTELRISEFDNEGGLEGPELVAGGAEESIFQPLWSPGGVLYFVSDRTGWWNLYRKTGRDIEPLLEMDAEFGLPQWVFGMSTYACPSENRLVCAFTMNGEWQLGLLDSNGLHKIKIPHTQVSSVSGVGSEIAFLGGSPSQSGAVTLYHTDTDTWESVRSSGCTDVPEGYFSLPEPIWFPTQKGRKAHGFFYVPQNPCYRAESDEKPPLLVLSHGGQTGATSSEFSLNIQYWTSRGFAVLDVNYGGSTGFGKPYRARLDGQWGVVDVDDCANGAKYLVDAERVDGRKLAIKGGSAGGFTTLAVLTFRDLFCAGASYYGISDLEALANETHKFESRYTDRLVGRLPEDLNIYRTRSPIHHVEALSVPVIFFQGSEDRVVPPNQAERMLGALSEKGIPVAYVLFEGEQHGFRRAENMKRALEAELYFYSKVLGFELVEPIAPVHIVNYR